MISKLNFLRKLIDCVDFLLLLLFRIRNTISRSIWKCKKKHWLDSYQPWRWQKVLSLRIKLWRKFKLSEAFVKNIWELIHKESLKQQ